MLSQAHKYMGLNFLTVFILISENIYIEINSERIWGNKPRQKTK